MKQNIKIYIAIKGLALSWVLLFSLVLPLCSKAQTNTAEQLVIPLSNPDKPFKLRLDLENGSITVIAHNGKDVLIETEPDLEKIQKGKPNQSQNQNQNQNQNINSHESKSDKGKTIGGKYLIGKESNNNITLNPVPTNKTLKVLIRVPKNAATLNLSTMYNGNITVSDVTGEMEVTNNIGAINLKNISGSAIANTVKGNITTIFRTIDSNAPMAFSTLVGTIDLSFPDSFKANVKLKSDDGILYTDFNIDFDKMQPQPTLNPTSQPGQYQTKIESGYNGKINGGGTEILIKNMHGNMYLRKTK